MSRSQQQQFSHLQNQAKNMNMNTNARISLPPFYVSASPEPIDMNKVGGFDWPPAEAQGQWDGEQGQIGDLSNQSVEQPQRRGWSGQQQPPHLFPRSFTPPYPAQEQHATPHTYSREANFSASRPSGELTKPITDTDTSTTRAITEDLTKPVQEAEHAYYGNTP